MSCCLGISALVFDFARLLSRRMEPVSLISCCLCMPGSEDGGIWWPVFRSRTPDLICTPSMLADTGLGTKLNLRVYSAMAYLAMSLSAIPCYEAMRW